MTKSVLTKITAGLCFAVLILALGYGAASQKVFFDRVYGKVLRLHIIASSQSDKDIAIKNTLAKEMKPVIDDVFKDCTDFEEALERAQTSSDFLCDKAKEELKKLSCNQNVRIETGKFRYDTRVLGGVTYPAGQYVSVRIVLGEGKGKNWWCVLFSPFTDTGIKREGDGTEKVRVKFFLTELFK